MASSVGARASLGLVLLGFGLAAATVVASDSRLSGWIYLGSTIQLAVALSVSWRVARPDRRIWVGLLVVVVLSVLGQVIDRPFVPRRSLERRSVPPFRGHPLWQWSERGPHGR